MYKSIIARSLLLAGVLTAGAAAQAQTYWSSTGTSDSPQQAGEASTMTNGVPNMVTTNSPYPDGTPVVVLAPNGSPYYGPQYYYPGQVVTTPSYPVYSAPYGTPVYPAVVAPSPSYSTYPNYPAVISHSPHNPAVVMPRQVVPSTSGPIVYYTR
jgi:hypothetical protein